MRQSVDFELIDQGVPHRLDASNPLQVRIDWYMESHIRPKRRNPIIIIIKDAVRCPWFDEEGGFLGDRR